MLSQHRLAWLSGGFALLVALAAIVVMTHARGAQANPTRTYSFRAVPDTEEDGTPILMLEARVDSEFAADARYDIRILEGGPGPLLETMRSFGGWDVGQEPKNAYARIVMDAPSGRPFQAIFTIKNAAGQVEDTHLESWTAP
jgi:hypothetical protein